MRDRDSLQESKPSSKKLLSRTTFKIVNQIEVSITQINQTARTKTSSNSP